MNITYLLGAGASYNALPIVEQIPAELESFANEFNPGRLSIIELRNFDYNKNSATKFLNKFIHDKEAQRKHHINLKKFHEAISWLKSEAVSHTSIDTFAKKLYLQENSTDLRKLKLILSCFFLYLQSKSNGFDKRYDSFFASVLDDLNELPEKIKILSWNYDSQLEKAFQNFSNCTLNEAKNILRIHSKGDVAFDSYDPNEFCIYKINGTTNVKKGNYEVKNILSDFNIDNVDQTELFLDSFKNLENLNFAPNMTFAWEEFNAQKGFFPNLSHSISQTEILIIIGYSFPFFNRKVDEFILNSMSNLKKIYVQDPNNSSDIIEKIKGLIPDKTHIINGYKEQIDYFEINYTDQFYIPIEF